MTPCKLVSGDTWTESDMRSGLYLPGGEDQMLEVVDDRVEATGFHILTSPKLLGGEFVEPDGKEPVEVVAYARHEQGVLVHAHGA